MLTYMLNSTGDGYEVLGESDKTLSRVIIPDMYEGLPVTEVSAMFVDFPNLTEIVIGNNVKKTGYGTFDCASLERIYLGKSISYISGPFVECTSLSDIYFSGTEEDWKKVSVVTADDSIENFTDAKMHYGVLGKSGFLMLGDEVLFPYTHWNCVKGKPESIDAKKVSYDNSISGLEADNVKGAIDELNAKHFDASALESWDELQHLVRSGKAAEFINVGDQFVCMKNGKELTWVVIGIDEDTPADERHTHSLTLQLDKCCAKMPFGFPEAALYLFYPLSAGKYYMGLKNYNAESTYYSFTLTEDVPADSLLRINNNTVLIYADRYSQPHKSIRFDSSSDTPEGMEGTELINTNYKLHNDMGTMNYAESDIRRWLNADDESWWISDTIFSLASQNYPGVKGFVNGIDEDFLAVINPVTKKTTLPDGTEVTTNDKFFLLSVEELYGSGDNYYTYYRDNSTLSEPSKSSDAVRIKFLETIASAWWLRDAADKNKGLMQVTATGSIAASLGSGNVTKGIVPACCIC